MHIAQRKEYVGLDFSVWLIYWILHIGEAEGRGEEEIWGNASPVPYQLELKFLHGLSDLSSQIFLQISL